MDSGSIAIKLGYCGLANPLVILVLYFNLINPAWIILGIIIVLGVVLAEYSALSDIIVPIVIFAIIIISIYLIFS